MSAFQLYKKRDFSAYINDTLQFFKQFGKDFFRNYVVINGAALLVLCAVYFIFMKENFTNMLNPTLAESWFMNNENIALFIGFMIIFTVVVTAFSILTTAFPIVYFNLVNNSDKEKFTASEIFAGIKSYAGRIFIFGLISMFILMPLAGIFMALGIALSFVIVGIPALILGLPTFMIWSMQSLFVYLEEDAGYFESLGKGWKITFSNYWHIVGSTLIVFMVVNTIGSSISMIPSIMTFTSILSGGNPEAVTMTPTMLVIYIVGMIVAYIFNNFFFAHQALIYYSSIETAENYQALSDIDNIGKNEE